MPKLQPATLRKLNSMPDFMLDRPTGIVDDDGREWLVDHTRMLFYQNQMILIVYKENDKHIRHREDYPSEDPWDEDVVCRIKYNKTDGETEDDVDLDLVESVVSKVLKALLNANAACYRRLQEITDRRRKL